MKIKISILDFLSIERAGNLREQYCPKSDSRQCGDWCPFFCEPINNWCLKICQDYLCGEIFDDRSAQKKEKPETLIPDFPDPRLVY